MEKILKENNCDKFNLISFSIAGIDSRVALSENKSLNKKLNKFVSIASPHNGSLLGSLIEQQKFPYSDLTNLSTLLGVHFSSLQDVSKDNMKKWNSFLEDHDDERYYSINGDKMLKE